MFPHGNKVCVPLFTSHIQSRIFVSVQENMKLLIVEDNPKMRNMLKDLFTPLFEQIYECEDGSQALQSYKLNKPDWVFMDIQMKEMNGIAATREITRSYPDAKILIVTDYNDEEFRKAAVNAGAVSYVLKEQLDDIFSIINK